MGTISYTIGQHEEDICTDIIFDDADAAREESLSQNEGAKVFRFEWDGLSAQSIKSLVEL